MNNKKLYPCYSVPLRDFLADNHIRYELVGLHPKTKLMFWVYIKNDELNKYLKIWKETNPNN